MEDYFQKVIGEFIPLQEQEGKSKVMSPAGAVERFVEPGMILHTGMAPIPPNAAIFELVRRFHDKDPGFTLVSSGLTALHAPLVHTGMVRKAITTFLGDSYPSPGPNPVYQKAYAEGKLQVEHWSLLTWVLRLKAAAMGVPFLPTRSLAGSSMESDNAGNFICREDPFGESGRIGLVRAPAPDISIYHGLAADEQGNTLFMFPLAENIYGALAGKRGVIVTVEKIVSSRFIREHAECVRLPGSRVLSVSEAPMGGHPGGCFGRDRSGIDSYAIDNPFILTLRKAGKKPETLQSWIREWILNCPDRSAYLDKLGSERIRVLKENASPDSWERALEEAAPLMSAQAPADPMERMVAAAARQIMTRVKKNGYRTLLAGIGGSNLAAWLAAYLLRRERYEIDIMAEIGFYGYLPRPAEPFIFNFNNIPTSKLLTDITETLGMLVGRSNCLGVLGAAQVDRFGNINSTLIPPNMLITGSGGSNDVAAAADEVLLVAPQSPYRFVAKVPYTTAPGDRMKTLISTLGCFEKRYGEKEFTLTGVIDDGKFTQDELVGTIKSQCGWDLKIASNLKTIPSPDPEELALLRLFDPNRFFLGG